MSLTNFPNGITSFGGVVGPPGYAGWWDSIAWFVNDEGGIDGNSGREPTKAFKTIQRAVDLAGPQDTIFLKPRDITVGQYHTHGYYTGNVTTTDAQQGLKIIGTGGGGARGWGANIQCAIEPTPASTAATILIQSPGVSIENVMVKAIAGSTGGGIGATNQANNEVYGVTISNCGFKDFIGMASTGSVHLSSINWATIQHCIFREGGIGIKLGSSVAATRDPIIRDCDFWGLPGDWDADILVGDVSNLLIDDCRFPHAVPTGGARDIYIHMEGTAGTGMISNCTFSQTTKTVSHVATVVGSVLLINCRGKDDEVIAT